MRPFVLCLSAAALAVLAARAAHADEAANTADLRCLSVAVIAANSPDPKQQAAAAASVMYWIGRLDGRNPGFNLEKRFADTISKMTADDLRNEAARCRAALKVRANALMEMTKQMSAPGDE